MELWSQMHIRTLLPSMVLMLVLALVLRKCLIGKEWKVRMIPFQILAVVFILLELGKQILSLIRGYDLYHLLFHFCSLVVIMVPMMAFYRGKHQQKIIAITASLLTSVVLLMAVYPALIYSADNVKNYFIDYFSFHTVTFHTLAVFAFFLVIALELYVPLPKRETTPILVYILVFCVLSATMANLLKTNYNNFYSCNVPPLESLRLSMQEVIGYGFTQVLYVLIVTALNLLFVLMSYWVIRGLICLVRGRADRKSVKIR